MALILLLTITEPFQTNARCSFCFNYSPYIQPAHILARAIDSVLAQSYPHWELLVIDNFSSDNTHELISTYQDKRIKFLQFANHGIIAKSINFALLHASFDLIAILDSTIGGILISYFFPYPHLKLVQI